MARGGDEWTNSDFLNALDLFFNLCYLEVASDILSDVFCRAISVNSS